MRATLSTAMDLLRQGHLDAAESCLRRALERNPLNAEACALLGVVRAQCGDLADAENLLRKAISLNPRDGLAYSHLGVVCERQGNVGEAIRCYRSSVDLDTAAWGAWANLGKLLHTQARYHQAIACYENSLRIHADNPEIRSLHAMLMHETGHSELATESLQKILAERPDFALAHNQLGEVLLGLGQFQPALEHFNLALKHDPGNFLPYFNIARTVRFEEDQQCAVRETARMRKALEQADRQSMATVPLYFALGDLCDRAGEYDQAFNFYQQGNRIEYAAGGFDITALQKDSENRCRYFTRENMATATPKSPTGSELVFIFGMPRSGTTLVEQLLAAHENVTPGGETLRVADLEKEVFPRCIGLLRDYSGIGRKGDRMRQVARRYVQSIRNSATDNRLYTEKTPANFRHLGLLSMLLPQARFIHCSRHPLDTCLSNYFQMFTSRHRYSFDLQAIAAYYQDYLRLMQHWKRCLSVPVLDLKYENWITQPETTGKSLYEFCGLEWRPEYLNMRQRKDAIHTSSVVQARQPIYASSVLRWKNYQQHLAPIRHLFES